MLKLLIIILPIAALLFCCWRFGSLRSAGLMTVLAVLAATCSVLSMARYGVSLKEFILLGHNSSLMTIELIVTLALTVCAVLQVIHSMRKRPQS